MKITRDQLLPFVVAKSTLRHAASLLGCSPQTVLNSLRKYELFIPPNVRKPRPEPVCSRCGETDRHKFYRQRKDSECWYSWCIPCSRVVGYNRARKTKQRIVEMLGGKCCLCGFSAYTSALELHHVDPSKKDLAFDGLRGWRWNRVLKEVEKCVLLCANCHRAYHHEELSPGMKQRMLEINLTKT